MFLLQAIPLGPVDRYRKIHISNVRYFSPVDADLAGAINMTAISHMRPDLSACVGLLPWSRNTGRDVSTPAAHLYSFV